MGSNARNLVLSLVSLGLVAAVWLFPGWRFQRAVRRAAYERYAALGDEARVKEVVDRHHAEVFDQCFVEGLPRRAKNFDVNKYGRLMDRRVEKELGDALAAKLAGILEKAEGAAPAPAARAPAPTATPAAHAIEIRGMQVKPAAPKPEEAGLVGKLFEVQIDVADEARDVSFREPPRVAVAVSCPGGETFTTDAPRIEAMPAAADGVTHIALRLLVPESTAGTGSGLCELSARVTDAAGNASQESKRFVALR